MTTRKAIWFFISLAAITAVAVLFSRAAHAGRSYGSSNEAAGIRTTTTDNLLLGNGTRVYGGGNPQIEITATGGRQAGIHVWTLNSGGAGSVLRLSKSSGTLAAPDLPNGSLAGLYMADGSAGADLAAIRGYFSATATAGSKPTGLLFDTTSAGATSMSQKAALDPSGRFIVNGVAAVPLIGGQYPHLYVSGTTSDGGTFAVSRSTADTGPAKMLCGKTRATSDGTLTAIASGDDLCQIGAYAADGSAYALSSYILFDTTGTIASGTAPGVMKFFTATASGTATQALQIDQTQMVTLSAGLKLGAASTPSSSSEACTTGEFRWDASYLYVCTATDTWARAALGAF